MSRCPRPSASLLRLAAPCLWTALALPIEYPGPDPGPARSASSGASWVLWNGALRASWRFDAPGPAWEVHDPAAAATLASADTAWPTVVLADDTAVGFGPTFRDTRVASTALSPTPDATRLGDRHPGRCLTARAEHAESGLELAWTAELRDGANYVVQRFTLSAKRDVEVQRICLFDLEADRVRRSGSVLGSVLLWGDGFLALEHPLARNDVVDGRARGEIALGRTLRPGDEWTFSIVVGVAPEDQLRRAFLHYVERERAHPYRQYLHYNSWYHLNILRGPDDPMTEQDCLAVVERVGHELVQERGVRLDGFVWDDGWDDHDSLWMFHPGFPNGFAAVAEAAAQHGASTGVWMSPWGGYGTAKARRLAAGREQGFETNANGFALAGPRYRARFRATCARMIDEYGVDFFKFDGLGSGNETAGAAGSFAEDVAAALELIDGLRALQPELFVSATVGTWPSPFFLRHVDSIWRQGQDTGFHGEGSPRERWITYRDGFVRSHVVGREPLYPLNSLMPHGLVIGDRGNPGEMERDGPAVAHEVWMAFACGTGLLELYIDPELLSDDQWDVLAAAARWARAHADVLADTHWIGGDPAQGQVYGYASWQPRKGILVLRNPSSAPAIHPVVLTRDLELPPTHRGDHRIRRVDADGGPEGTVAVGERFEIDLRPFEVVVLEAAPVGAAR